MTVSTESANPRNPPHRETQTPRHLAVRWIARQSDTLQFIESTTSRDSDSSSSCSTIQSENSMNCKTEWHPSLSCSTIRSEIFLQYNSKWDFAMNHFELYCNFNELQDRVTPLVIFSSLSLYLSCSLSTCLLVELQDRVTPLVIFNVCVMMYWYVWLWHVCLLCVPWHMTRKTEWHPSLSSKPESPFEL